MIIDINYLKLKVDATASVAASVAADMAFLFKAYMILSSYFIQDLRPSLANNHFI